MPEQEPAPEFEPKEKIQCQCWKCNHTVRSTLANTSNHIFTRQAYFNHTQLQCMDEECLAATVLFHDQIPDKSIAIAMQYPTSIFEYCDQEDIHEVRKNCVEAHDLEITELSQRSLDIVAHWGEFLQKIIVDETDFQ